LNLCFLCHFRSMSRRLVGSLRAYPQSFRVVWNQKKDSGLIFDKTRTRARTTEKGNPIASYRKLKFQLPMMPLESFR
jgi:hypothetical protein